MLSELGCVDRRAEESGEDARSVEPGRLFDAAVGRLVLMYMRDPTDAVRLIAERIRPGGVVAYVRKQRDPDYDHFSLIVRWSIAGLVVGAVIALIDALR